MVSSDRCWINVGYIQPLDSHFSINQSGKYPEYSSLYVSSHNIPSYDNEKEDDDDDDAAPDFVSEVESEEDVEDSGNIVCCCGRDSGK